MAPVFWQLGRAARRCNKVEFRARLQHVIVVGWLCPVGVVAASNYRSGRPRFFPPSSGQHSPARLPGPTSRLWLGARRVVVFGFWCFFFHSVACRVGRFASTRRRVKRRCRDDALGGERPLRPGQATRNPIGNGASFTANLSPVRSANSQSTPVPRGR